MRFLWSCFCAEMTGRLPRAGTGGGRGAAPLCPHPAEADNRYEVPGEDDFNWLNRPLIPPTSGSARTGPVLSNIR